MVRALEPEHLYALEKERGGAGRLPYQDPRVKALVWEIKYRRNARACELAGRYLGELLLAAAAEELGRPLLIPVPLHAARRKERGYNQTELLCEAALKHSGDAVEYAPRALTRILDTPHQQGLPSAVRFTNVKNSMRAEKAVAGRSCIVVDDVTTTGATLEEAKRALTEAGAVSVQRIALAYS